MKKDPVSYARLGWTPNDVKTLRPKWSLKKCEEFLVANERRIQDRLTELGWEIIEVLLP